MELTIHLFVRIRRLLIAAAHRLELDEEGTRISLTIVDTPGFGDQIDNEARYITPYPRISIYSSNTGQLAFLRSSDTSSDNTTTFLRKSHVSSVTLDSGITVSMSSYTSSPRPVTGESFYPACRLAIAELTNYQPP